MGEGGTEGWKECVCVTLEEEQRGNDDPTDEGANKSLEALDCAIR